MKTYKVFDVEDKKTASGKGLKKLVLQADGDQYPTKNVTMWEDHPLYETIAAGQEHALDVEVKDSSTPNPHGGFYKDRTVLKPGQSGQTSDTDLSEVLASLKRIEDHLGITDDQPF